MKLALTTAAAFSVAAVAANAAPITLSNAGIETNASTQFGSIDDWGPNGGWGLHSGFANAGYDAGTMGNNFGFYAAGTSEYVLQATGVTIAADTNYSVNLGAVTGGGNDTGTVAYVLAYVNPGADLSDGIDVGEFTVFASATQVVGDPWVAGTGVTSTASGAAIGQELLVGLGSGAEGGADDIWFDNFTADATAVPEPGSLALIGLGGLALLRRRR